MAKSSSPPSYRHLSLVLWWGGALKAIAQVSPVRSGTVRSQGGEQRVATTEKSPEVLLCTICFRPSNVVCWAGEKGMMR